MALAPEPPEKGSSGGSSVEKAAVAPKLENSLLTGETGGSVSLQSRGEEVSQREGAEEEGKFGRKVRKGDVGDINPN